MTAFLASTKNLAEARLAIRAGADWIDMKDPASGALGAVSPQCIGEVVAWLASESNDTPTSATIGDCWDTPHAIPERVRELVATGVKYAKIGLYARAPSRQILDAIAASCNLGPKIILVCFAEAPPLQNDLERFAALGVDGAMLDTAQKSGRSLCELLERDALQRFVATCRELALVCGLAGRLSIDDIANLSACTPDYLGFRGALCDGAKREAGLSLDAARRVRETLDHVLADQFVAAGTDRGAKKYLV